MHEHRRTPKAALIATGIVIGLGACSSEPAVRPSGSSQALEDLSCSVPESEIFVGAFRDGIPALTDPEMQLPGFEETSLWQDDDRVVGMVLGDQPIAVPLNIFWWHEIVNLDMDGYSVAITHCPLTGSSLAFDREPQGGVEFGVSGLLFRNNLMMYDRTGENESLWPQMSRGARCGPKDGQGLDMLPVVEMTYGKWRRIHPNTLVVTSETGWDRDYSSNGYPYRGYDDRSNPELLFPISGDIDTRFPPKARVLGVPEGTGGTAFLYSELNRLGDRAVVTMESANEDYVVFWDEEAWGAMAYHPTVDGQPLTFEVRSEKIVDEETGSTWNMSGQATGGELAGSRLEPIDEAYVAFWFAWPLFQPDIQVWSAS
ncbi:MAG: DUF3179 domain-containing protein [Gemmatimonadota bacterium]|nr:DUF3179 domain-containing protein [Gemmatimonadota bacterium]